jgi:hypothetical protein
MDRLSENTRDQAFLALRMAASVPRTAVQELASAPTSGKRAA